MSHGGWEVVGKNKKDKTNGKPAKLSKAENKKFLQNAPKLEDFLPLDQVKTLYNNLDNNKENKKPAKEKENKTKENEEKKKQQKQKQQQQQQQQAEKKKSEPKDKPPKSIEGALNAISVEELKNLLATGQARYPDAPLVWLKDISAFLNVKIPIETSDPIFANKPAEYPLSIVPNTIRSVMEKAIKDAGIKTAQLFYDLTLTTMANDMAKNTPVIGHKIFLQFLAYQQPEIVLSNVSKLVTLRNSYQNRKPIGQSLLWALSQSGLKNLSAGLKIWHDVMAPMLEMKNYANYVSEILARLSSIHSNSTGLNSDLYLSIVDDVYSNKYNIPAGIEKELGSSIQKLRIIVFKNTRCHTLFPVLMKKLTHSISSNYKQELLNALVVSLQTDAQCYSAWRSHYTKYLYQSSLLLKHINNNWTRVNTSINIKLLRETVLTFNVTNGELGKAKRKEEHLNSCSKECKALLEKMTASKSWFPWKKGSILLLILIGSILAYDTHKHGSFKDSNTNEFLVESGVAAYSEQAWTRVQLYCSKSLEFMEASAPEYYKAVTEFSKPYIKLAGDLCLTTRNIAIKVYNNVAIYASQKAPIIMANINHYAPGLLENVQKQSIQAMEWIKTYSLLASDQAYLLFGQINTENLRKYTSQAIDTTQTIATQTYDWVYEKVQTLSKVQ